MEARPAHAIRSTATALLLLSLGAAPAWAQAQSSNKAPVAAEAKRLDDEARAAFSSGDFVRAAKLFERANRIAPHAATQFNAALAWERAGELALAADAYESALGAETLAPRATTTARDRLAALKRNLGYIIVSEPLGGTAQVDDGRKLPIPTKIHVSPGTHRVTLRATDGVVSSESVEVLAGERTTVKFVRAGTTTSPLPPRPAPARRDRTQKSSSSPLLGWVFVGAAGAMAITAGVLGVETLRRRDACHDEDDLAECDRARSYRIWTNVFAAGALVSGGVGVYLLAFRPSDSQSGALSPPTVHAIVSF